MTNEKKIKVVVTHGVHTSQATVSEPGLWNLIKQSGAESLVVTSINGKPVPEGRIV